MTPSCLLGVTHLTQRRCWEHGGFLVTRDAVYFGRVGHVEAASRDPPRELEFETIRNNSKEFETIRNAPDVHERVLLHGAARVVDGELQRHFLLLRPVRTRLSDTVQPEGNIECGEGGNVVCQHHRVGPRCCGLG